MTLPTEVQDLLAKFEEQGVDISNRQEVVALAGHSSHEGAYLNGIHPDEWEATVNSGDKSLPAPKLTAVKVVPENKPEPRKVLRVKPAKT